MKLKRIMSVVTAGAVVASSLAGCGGGSGSSGDKVNLSIYQFKVEAKDAFQKAIDQYEKENPNVKINMETVGGGDDYATSLKAKMQADEPVIFNVGGPQELNNWKDKLEDLSDQPWVSHAMGDSLDGGKIGDKVYGLPMNYEAYGFVINRQIFEDAGVSFDSMLTFDGMKKGFDTLKQKIDSGEMKEKYPNLEAVMEYPAKEQWVLGDHDVNPILAQEFSSATEAYNAQTLSFKASDAYQKMVDFQASYTTNANSKATLNSVDYSQSLEGGLAIERVAAIEQGDWIVPTMKATNADVLNKLDMLPYSLPGYEDGKYCGGVSEYWVVNSTATDAQKKAAKDFLNWMYQSDEGKKILVDDAGFKPPFDNYGDLTPDDPLSKRTVEAEKDQNKIMPGFVYQGAPDTWTQKVMGAQVQKYLSGEESWSDAVKTGIEQWQQLRASSGSSDSTSSAVSQ